MRYQVSPPPTVLHPRRRARRRAARRALVLCGASVLGCGGGQTRGHPLDSRWADDDGAELAAFQRSWDPGRVAPRPEVAVGVVDPGRMVGRAFADGRRWELEHALESRPCIAGSLVVGVGGGELFAVDAATGELMWARPSVGALRGADDDGATTVVSLASLGGLRSIVLAVARNGRVIRQLYVPEPVGAPAVLGGYAFLPWSERLVVIFDLLEGREAARVVSTEPLGRATIVDAVPFFGERQLLAFDEHIVEARRGAGSVARLPAQERPESAATPQAGGAAPASWATGGDRHRLYARPVLGPAADPSGRARIAGGRVMRTAGRLALGLDATTGRLEWLHVGAAPVLGGAAGAGSFMLCDAAGEVRWLEASTGALLRRDRFGTPVIACEVSAGNAAPPVRAGAPPSRAALDAALVDSIREALERDDPAVGGIGLE